MTTGTISAGASLSQQQREEAAHKSRWTTVGCLSLLQLTENSEGGLVNTVFPIIRAGLGLDLGALGVLTAVGKFARMLTGPMWAIFADRFGRKLILVVSALWAAWTIAAGLAQNFNQLLILYALGVIGTTGGEPIANGMVGDLFGPSERGKVFGTMRSITGIGSIIITPLMGQLAGVPNNNGWRYGMFIMGGIGVVAALLSWIFVKDPKARVKGEKSGEGFRIADVPRLFAIPTVALLAVQLIFITSLVLFAFQVTFLVDVRGYTTQLGAFMVSIFFVGFTISSFFGGMLGDWFAKKNPRTGRVTMMQLYLVAFAVMSFLAMQVPWPKTPAVLGIGLIDALMWILFGLVASLGFSGCVLPMVSGVVPPAYRATAFALLFSFIQGALAAIFALVLGPIAKSLGFQTTMLLLVTISYAINAVFWFLFYRTYPRDQERMRELMAAQAAGGAAK
jgi:MFS family permease